MKTFDVLIEELKTLGYVEAKARSKVAHDVILKAIESSGLSQSVTIKGGVVMSDITDDVRRATMDIDFDFVRYPLTEKGIETFVKRLNCIDGVEIRVNGKITDLKQKNYQGKRLSVQLKDRNNTIIQTKIDIGVHTYAGIKQPSHHFKLKIDRRGAKLPANTGEQVFAEKLKSLLRFGSRSGRLKDIFDMYYLIDVISERELKKLVKILVFDDPTMRERDFPSIALRLSKVFVNKGFIRKLDKVDVNWLELDSLMVTSRILSFIQKMVSG